MREDNTQHCQRLKLNIGTAGPPAPFPPEAITARAERTARANVPSRTPVFITVAPTTVAVPRGGSTPGAAQPPPGRRPDGPRSSRPLPSVRSQSAAIRQTPRVALPVARLGPWRGSGLRQTGIPLPLPSPTTALPRGLTSPNPPPALPVTHTCCFADHRRGVLKQVSTPAERWGFARRTGGTGCSPRPDTTSADRARAAVAARDDRWCPLARTSRVGGGRQWKQ